MGDFRSMPVFGDQGLPTRVYAMAERPGVDTRLGRIMTTGRDLDVAIQGEGWIAVQAPDDGEAYTRAGDLQVDANGLLTTANGRPVLGLSLIHIWPARCSNRPVAPRPEPDRGRAVSYTHLDVYKRQVATQLVGDVERGRVVRPRQQHGEFLAAEARDKIRTADAAGQLLGHAAQYLVAGRVAVAVVDVLRCV